MQWLEVVFEPLPGKLDELCFFLEESGMSSLVIEDKEDFENFLENNRQYWDYVDEALQEQYKNQSAVKFYLSADENGQKIYENLKSGARELVGKTSYRLFKDEDWENNWMKYYKPIPVGERLLIVPAWEDAPEASDRLILKLNPGLIFGTGSHPTTAMCLIELEKHAPGAARVLDLGCGSGILAIASLILGAQKAFGYDIDPKAPDTAIANASYNSISPDSFYTAAGDILNDKDLRKQIYKQKYDLITANIIADVIIHLAPDVSDWLEPEGKFICSGIIEGRQSEVENALLGSGMVIINHLVSEDWHCYTAEIKKRSV